jgi:hypothetical protein
MKPIHFSIRKMPKHYVLKEPIHFSFWKMPKPYVLKEPIHFCVPNNPPNNSLDNPMETPWNEFLKEVRKEGSERYSLRDCLSESLWIVLYGKTVRKLLKSHVKHFPMEISLSGHVIWLEDSIWGFLPGILSGTRWEISRGILCRSL